jgi:hypothetical protein
LFQLAWASNAWAQTAPAATATAPAPAPSVPPATAPTAPTPAERATAAFPPASETTPYAAPAAAPAAPAPAVPRQARVRFNANEPGAVLESDVTADGRPAQWYVVCEAPCTSTVSKSGAFRVGGRGYHQSRVFRLPEERSEFKIDGEMEDSSIALPMAITIVGGVIASAGSMMLLAAYAEDQQTFRDADDLGVPGAIVAGSGALIATVGVIMLVIDAQHDESKARVAEAARGFTF